MNRIEIKEPQFEQNSQHQKQIYFSRHFQVIKGIIKHYQSQTIIFNCFNADSKSVIQKKIMTQCNNILKILEDSQYQKYLRNIILQPFKK
ncbi:hypothetical protein pb186bvf_017966 [Paramecium bursaria]